MKIPIRAMYSRSTSGTQKNFKPELIDAVYADVPTELILGRAAQAARDMALHAGDEDAVVTIDRAIERACADGKLKLMD